MRTIDTGITSAYAAATTVVGRRRAGRAAASGHEHVTEEIADPAGGRRDPDRREARRPSTPHATCGGDAVLGQRAAKSCAGTVKTGSTESLDREPGGLGGSAGTAGDVRDRAATREATQALRFERLPPADHRQPGRPHGQHRGEVAVRRGLPRDTCSGTPRSSCCRSSSYTQPDTARALLRYRHHTLDGARANSREIGTGGARYAWESADTGRERVPAVHRGRCQPVLDPRGGGPRLGRRRLRDLPLRRGDRRPGVPARLRRGGAVRDQPVLGGSRQLLRPTAVTSSSRSWGPTSSTPTSTTTRSPTASRSGTSSRPSELYDELERHHPDELAAVEKRIGVSPRSATVAGGRRGLIGRGSRAA